MLSHSPRRRARGALRVVACLAVVAAARFATEGLYTKEQAERGRAFYDASCASCHGAQLEGGTSVPLAGDEFKLSWGRPDLTLDDFYYIVRKTMPKETPGTLTREAYTDVVAYVLQQNGFPEGEKELTPDPALLRTIRFGTPVRPLHDHVLQSKR